MLRKVIGNKGAIAVIICLSVIIIDQIIKIWIKTSFYWGEDMEILPWFHLKFIQNNGMAFGMELGSKLFLSLFRIIAVAAGIWYLTRICRKTSKIPMGFIVCIALITAGAAGNIIDCTFYGMIFDNPLPRQIAHFVPWGEGYSSLFHGLVVDMFYFPLFSWTWPDWLPILGGQEFTFFDPVFNFADACISVGMIVMLVFYYKQLGSSLERNNKTEQE